MSVPAVGWPKRKHPASRTVRTGESATERHVSGVLSALNTVLAEKAITRKDVGGAEAGQVYQR